MLSYIEYRTPALYHSTRAVLDKLDAVQKRFLQDAGVDEVSALTEFHLAPLGVRRDIAMLGMIHRTVLGRGVPHLKEFFKRSVSGAAHKHRLTLQDPLQDGRNSFLKRTAIGLIAVYSLLPPTLVAAASVASFQKGLQQLVIARAKAGCEDWPATLSPRVALEKHPLR